MSTFDSAPPPISWKARRQPSVVLQTEGSECALACLAMIAGYHGHDIDLASLRRQFSSSLKGIDLARMMEIAHALGLDARPLRAELEYLPLAQVPCVLHWEMNHFVVLSRMNHKGAEILDPAKGRYRLPITEISKRFTGIVLELSPEIGFTPIKARRHISLRDLTGKVTGLGPVIAQIFGIALAIEAISLALPFQMQYVFDQAVLSSDKSLLVFITLGFLMVNTVQASLAVGRGWVISWMSANISTQWTNNLFGHLLKLPLDFFEKRHMGDVLSRFSSLQAIQRTITSSFVEAAIDGIMGMLALGILLLYSADLTACILIATGLYAILRWVLYQRLWQINEEQLVFGAKQQTELMESVRGILAIKLANRQSDRRARLANATVETAHRLMRTQRIDMFFAAANRWLFGTQRIALVGLGAYLVITNRFSAGMLMAFLAYADQFSNKVGSLIDKVVEFSMLKLHAERIADIALTEPEPSVTGSYTGADPTPCIEITGLSFRYAEGEPWVIRNLNLTIADGSSIAIVGPSGCGKTTLAKILLGLLTPQEGEIKIGGVPIHILGQTRYRSMLAAVMQDDQLFSGSIADNISFFCPSASLSEIQAAAQAAAIHTEITAMPMGYETMVGDMGSALSGGQRQRIILARALYRNPKILLLDEATSHLDLENEHRANEAIRKLKTTRIIVAHRRETIALADRVFDLSKLPHAAEGRVAC